MSLFSTIDPSFDHAGGHILYAGSSGTGKTQSLIALARHKLRNPLTGLIVIDPDGEICPASYEYCANPLNDLAWRRVHYLKPASSSESFSLPLLSAPDRDPAICHRAALRTKTIFEQAVSADAGEYGPRLTKLFFLGTLCLALNGWPLAELPNLFTRGARFVRESLAAALPYHFLADEWTSLDLLADRQFLEYRDALMSRLFKVFGNAHLRRVFGAQAPVDIAHVLRHREVVLLDLSGLEHDDAVLVGKALYSIVHHQALQREPNREPHTSLMVDEAFDYLTPDMARGFDRLRKRNVQLILAIQRLAQLNKGEDDTVSVMSAVITNTPTKVSFRMTEPDDCEYMTRVVFTGFIPLNEYKEGTERPVVVGHHKEIVANRSTAVHQAEHEATSETTGVAHGYAETHSHAVTEADGESETDATMEAMGLGTMTSDAAGIATSTFDGMSNSASLDPNSGGIIAPFAIIGMGTAASTGTGTTASAVHGDGTSKNSSSGSSHAVSRSHMVAVTQGHATSESIVKSHAISNMRGTSRGTSESAGEAETFVATIEWLPSQLYSLPEQLHRLAGEISNLPLRECFVKIGCAKPVRARTSDLAPAFACDFFKRIALPRYHALTLARSPYLIPCAEADALLAAPALPEPPQPSFAPEAMPMLDNPDAHGRDFWVDKPKLKEGPRKPRRPKAGRLSVIDGGKADGDTPEGGS